MLVSKVNLTSCAAFRSNFSDMKSSKPGPQAHDSVSFSGKDAKKTNHKAIIAAYVAALALLASGCSDPQVAPPTSVSSSESASISESEIESEQNSGEQYAQRESSKSSNVAQFSSDASFLIDQDEIKDAETTYLEDKVAVNAGSITLLSTPVAKEKVSTTKHSNGKLASQTVRDSETNNILSVTKYEKDGKTIVEKEEYQYDGNKRIAALYYENDGNDNIELVSIGDYLYSSSGKLRAIITTDAETGERIAIQPYSSSGTKQDEITDSDEIEDYIEDNAYLFSSGSGSGSNSANTKSGESLRTPSSFPTPDPDSWEGDKNLNDPFNDPNAKGDGSLRMPSSFPKPDDDSWIGEKE